MPTFHIRHVTTYRYRAPVAFGEHRLRLRPRESADQRTVSASIDISPQPVALQWSEDASGNLLGLCRFGRRAKELRFTSTVTVEQAEIDLATLRLAEHALTTPFSYGAEEAPELARFIERQHPDPDHAVDAFARRVLVEDPSAATLPFLSRLSSAIQRDFAYLRRDEAGIQFPTETLRLRSGSCRDFAVLMAEAARSVGLAARFVSGYVDVQSDDPVLSLAGGNTHAWLQVYLPGAGWIDFDPTSGRVGNKGLVRIAVVRDPRSALPLTGSFLGFPSDFLEMNVVVSVSRAPHACEVAPTRIRAA